jgi:hypothetical protein
VAQAADDRRALLDHGVNQLGLVADAVVDHVGLVRHREGREPPFQRLDADRKAHAGVAAQMLGHRRVGHAMHFANSITSTMFWKRSPPRASETSSVLDRNPVDAIFNPCDVGHGYCASASSS